MHVCDPVERIFSLLLEKQSHWLLCHLLGSVSEAALIMHIGVVQTDPGIAPITGSRFSDYCDGDHMLERWDQSRFNSIGGRIQLHIPRGRTSPCLDLPL